VAFSGIEALSCEGGGFFIESPISGALSLLSSGSVYKLPLPPAGVSNTREKSMTRDRSMQSGFTLNEFAIVLGVMGLILGGIWTMAKDVNNSANQEKLTEMLRSITDNVRGVYAGKSSFDTTNATTMMTKLVAKNVFPTESLYYDTSTWTVISPFGRFTHPYAPASSNKHRSLYVCGWRASGSTRCILTGAAGTTDVPFFAIEVLANKADCILAAVRNSTAQTQPGLVGVFINGNEQTLPLTPAAATNATTGCISTAANYIDFIYRLTP